MVSRRLQPFGTTIFTEITARAQAVGAVNLAQGFPDFDGPDFVKQAAIQAIEGGQAQYARMTGIPALHEAIAGWYARRRGLTVQPGDGIVVTSGATEAIHDAVVGLCDPGDEVVLFEPFYDSYHAVIRMAGATPRAVRLHAPDWTFDPAELAAAFGPRTRLVIVNTPHNPTGRVMRADELDAIAALAIAHDVTVLADEVYEELVYDGQHVSIATRPGMADRTITVSSLGKTFSLTGWKVGWAVGAPERLVALRRAHQFVTFATATPLQWAAATALNADDATLDAIREPFLVRRAQLVDGLAALDFDVTAPEGGYFATVGFRRHGWTSDTQAVDALMALGVAAIPPSSFYLDAPGGLPWVRFAFCKRTDTIAEGLRRLGAGLGCASHPVEGANPEQAKPRPQ